MAGSVYLRRVQARRQYQQPDDVQRGWEIGQEIGKALGGLGTAIQGAQKNALANKLMTDQAIANQPGAGQTISLGKLPGGPQPAASGDQPDPNADLSTDLPEDVSSSLSTNIPPQTFTNPATGNIEPVSGTGGAYSGTAPDSTVAQNVAAFQLANTPAQPGDFTLNPSDYSGGSGPGTVGSLIHTGGVEEMNLRKEMLAQQIQQQNLSNSQQAAALKLADAQAKAAGTGPYATTAALKRAQLAAAQAKAAAAAKGKPVDLEKNPPPATNLDSEPVINQTQLDNTIGGKNSSDQLASSLMVPMKVPDPNNPDKTIPNPDPSAPVISGDPSDVTKQQITFGPKNKRTTMPLAQAQIYAKQINSLKRRQGSPLIRVPGEDQSIGETPDNPYVAKNKLDALSRAKGTYVRLPPTPQNPNPPVVQVGDLK